MAPSQKPCDGLHKRRLLEFSRRLSDELSIIISLAHRAMQKHASQEDLEEIRKAADRARATLREMLADATN